MIQLHFKDRTRMTMTVTGAAIEEVSSQLSCYWQIDYMMKHSSLGTFPLAENQPISVKDSLASQFMQIGGGTLH